MLKPVLFISLYSLVGISSWEALSAIAEKDTSINTLSQLAVKTTHEMVAPQPENYTVHRWKDYQGNWIYAKQRPMIIVSLENYEKELSFLQRIPKEALPSKSIDLESIESVFSDESLKPTDTSNMEQFITETKNIVSLLSARKKMMDELALTHLAH